MVNPWLGAKENLGIATESSRGAGAAPDAYIPVVSLDFKEVAEKVRTGSRVGKLADDFAEYVVRKGSEGNIVCNLDERNIGYFLYSIFGTLATQAATPAAGANTHTFTFEDTNLHKSLAIVLDRPTGDNLFKGCMVDSLKISAKAGEVVKFEATIKGKKPNTDTRTADYSAGANFLTFLQQHVSIKFATNLAGLAAASVIAVKSFEININQNVIGAQNLGSIEEDDLYNQQISVDGFIELYFQDETYRDYMLDNSYKAMQIALTHTTSISGSTVPPTLTFQLPRVSFFEWERDSSNDAIATQKINFRGNYDLANSDDVIDSAVLVSGKTSF